MKKQLYILFVFILVQITLLAQAPPQGINYQAMVYVPYGNQQVGVNSAGQIPANNAEVKVTFAIENGVNGPLVYEETHLKNTDTYGLLTAVIGTGNPTNINPQAFNQINWGQIDAYLRVSILLTRYNSSVTSYQKLWSVPYAFYTAQANSSTYADTSRYATVAGNGITGVTDNGNGTLTFNYYDGSTYTTGQLSGLTGPQGSAGATGPQGATGANGLSAYQIWLQQGNTGTQTDFLNSITGPQGQQGNTGPQGPMGGFTHYLGELYLGGIIYELYKGSDGLEHGLIVSLTESTSNQWQTINSFVSADRTEDGTFNTGLMINSPAANYVSSLGAGWYLPSIDELGMLYYNRYYVQKALRAGGNTLLSISEYWSSSEAGLNHAWYFSFHNGTAYILEKGSAIVVRAIRAF